MSTNKPAKSPIIHNGREYVSYTAYCDMYYFENHSEINNRIKAGMPHLRIRRGKRKLLYFNLEDCGNWHLYGHLEGK